MRKRIVSTLMALVMVLSLLPVQVLAAGADYTTGEDTAVRKAVRMQTAGSADITGSGASDDPYLIYTAAGLKAFRDKVNGQNGQINQSDAHAKLMADIVLNDGTFDEDGNYTPGASGKDAEEWTPIGTEENNSYSGTFDGAGYTIKGLYVKDQQYAGLFGRVMSCTAGEDKFEFAIKDLTVTGYIGINTDSGTAARAGGIVGHAEILPYDDNVSGTISNCVSHVIINACNTHNASTHVYAGGIVGFVNLVDYNNHTGKMEITNCANYAAITAHSENGNVYVGGIAGQIEGTGPCVQKIDACFNAGRISGNIDNRYSNCVGGIIGLASSVSADSSIESCLNVGEVTGTAVSSNMGGIAGNIDKISISNCCNAGKVGGDGGGIAKNVYGATVSNCYYLEGTAGMAYVDNPSKYGLKTKEEFADGTVLALLKNGDTDSPWDVCGYLDAAGMIVPMLKGQTSDAFLIYTADDLKAFRDIVNGSNGQTQNASAHGILMNDIVLNDGTFDADGNWSESGTPDQWTPIVGNYGYGGTFDGDGHTIRGLYVKGGEYAGLFGNVWGGTVKNVTVTGYVEGTRFVGGIAGYGNNASITGCTNAAVVKAKCDGSFVDVGGIVGYFFANGNVGNCANLGSVWAQIDSNQGMAKVGGIAGSLGHLNVTIADCYNAGSIAIEDSGTGEYDVVSYLGGIVGSTLMTLEPSYISNCYSVGPLTYSGSASAVICGIAGYVDSYGIINCYWLKGTAESGVGGDPRQVTNTDAKSKQDFANGTVLELLKGDRTDSPWADECQYVAAAGMTLPVFKGQGDSHTHSEKTGDCTNGIYCECGYLMHGAESEHSWSAWQHLTTSHTRTCNNPGCGITQSGNCSGGTATCTEQATCKVCHEKYGDLKPHSFTAENTDAQYLKTAATCTTAAVYYKSCAVCGEVGTETFTSGSPAGHSWGAWTSNGDDTHTRHCTVEGCGGVSAAPCSGGTATCVSAAVCTVCGQTYGNKDAGNHDLKHTAAKEPGVFVSGHIEYWQCSACGKYFADANGAKEISQSDTIIPRRRRTADSEGGKASPATFDAGIGVCAVTAVTSLAGLTLLRRKRRDGE